MKQKIYSAAYGRFFIGADMPDTYRITVTTKSGETHEGLMNRRDIERSLCLAESADDLKQN